MTNSTGEGHENGGATDGSYFPDASEIDTIMTGGRINSGPGQLVFVPDGDGGSWYLDSCPNTPKPDDHASTDRPLFSDANEPENWESSSSTLRTHRREVADQPDHSSVMVDESANFGNAANAITHGNNREHPTGDTNPSGVDGNGKCPADFEERIAAENSVIGDRQHLLPHRRWKSSSSS